MSARDTALDALIACRKDGAWSNGILKTYLSRDRLDRRDGALASRLCYGVLQNRGLLDHYLSQLLTGKLKDLHPVLRDILHLGLYQILLLDKIPDSAAVDQAVAQARRRCKWKSAPGLVNGVLRNAVRKKDTLLPPDSLSCRYSHPQELVDLLRDNVGQSAMESVLRENNRIPPLTVQVNTLRTDTAALKAKLENGGFSPEIHPWLKDCLILSGGGAVEQLPGYEEGEFYIQDAASRLSVLCGDIPAGGRVLDCCAAPGGKTFAAVIGGAGTVVSCDIYPHKIDLIRAGARRLGLSGITPQVRDAAAVPEEAPGSFDTVIVDAPCSGLGIIRKKPDIRYKDLKETEQLPALQSAILERQAGLVRPGGVLLYSTCTVLRRENEEVAERFLTDHPEFTPEALPLPEIFPENRSGMLTLLPGQYGTDGFFICRMRRK